MLFSLRLAAFATISFAVAGHALAAPPGVTVLGARTQNSSAATAAAPAMERMNGKSNGGKTALIGSVMDELIQRRQSRRAA